MQFAPRSFHICWSRLTLYPPRSAASTHVTRRLPDYFSTNLSLRPASVIHLLLHWLSSSLLLRASLVLCGSSGVAAAVIPYLPARRSAAVVSSLWPSHRHWRQRFGCRFVWLSRPPARLIILDSSASCSLDFRVRLPSPHSCTPRLFVHCRHARNLFQLASAGLSALISPSAICVILSLPPVRWSAT
jgi:hypothetical protein